MSMIDDIFRGRGGGRRRGRSGFTLIEVMIAMFILGIGMIMVITIFPVGADWTRQATDNSISQVVAQNALAVIQSHYPSNQQLPNAPTTTASLAAFPNLGVIPPAAGITVSEMCYQFGSDKPFPGDVTKANYFWTALIRPKADVAGGSMTRYDVYILVFKKGDRGQTYGDPALSPKYTINTTGELGVLNFAEITRTRAKDPSGDFYGTQPAIGSLKYSAGTYDAASGKVFVSGNTLVPAIGEYGIGVESGTVFRQGLATDNYGVPVGATPRPGLKGGLPPTEDIIVGVPLMSGSAIVGPSPLIYVFQTTMSWKTPPAPPPPPPPPGP